MIKKFKFIKILTLIFAASVSCCSLFFYSNDNHCYALKLQNVSFEKYKNEPAYNNIFGDFSHVIKNKMYKKDIKSLISKIETTTGHGSSIAFDENFNINLIKKKRGLQPVNNVNVSVDYVNNMKCLKVNDFRQRIDLRKYPKIKTGEENNILYDNLQQGDLIISINGRKISDLTDYELLEAVEELKANRVLHIAFLRHDSDESKYLYYESDMDKDYFWEESLLAFQKFEEPLNKSGKKNKVLYIKFKDIDYGAYNLFTDLLKEIDPTDTKSLIIDLTNCCSLNYDAAKKIACLFLPKGTDYITFKNLNGDKKSTILKNFENQLIKTMTTIDDINQNRSIQLNIIVNEKTSDAAIQLAAILKKCACAKLYGKHKKDKENKKKSKSYQLERKIFDVYDNEGDKDASCCALLFKTAYEIGNNPNFETINSLNVDFERSCESDEKIKQIIYEIVSGSDNSTTSEISETASDPSQSIIFTNLKEERLKPRCVNCNYLKKSVEEYCMECIENPARGSKVETMKYSAEELNNLSLLQKMLLFSYKCFEHIANNYLLSNVDSDILTSFNTGAFNEKYNMHLFNTFLKNLKTNSKFALPKDFNRDLCSEGTIFSPWKELDFDFLPRMLSFLCASVQFVFLRKTPLELARNKKYTPEEFFAKDYLPVKKACESYSADMKFNMYSFNKFLNDSGIYPAYFDMNYPIPFYYFILCLQRNIEIQNGKSEYSDLDLNISRTEENKNNIYYKNISTSGKKRDNFQNLSYTMNVNGNGNPENSMLQMCAESSAIYSSKNENENNTSYNNSFLSNNNVLSDSWISTSEKKRDSGQNLSSILNKYDTKKDTDKTENNKNNSKIINIISNINDSISSKTRKNDDVNNKSNISYSRTKKDKNNNSFSSIPGMNLSDF